MSVKGLRIPTYDAKNDGNVFLWLIKAAQDYRMIRQREREVALKNLAVKATTK